MLQRLQKRNELPNLSGHAAHHAQGSAVYMRAPWKCVRNEQEA